MAGVGCVPPEPELAPELNVILRNGTVYDGDGKHTGALPGRVGRGPGYKQAQ